MDIRSARGAVAGNREASAILQDNVLTLRNNITRLREAELRRVVGWASAGYATVTGECSAIRGTGGSWESIEIRAAWSSTSETKGKRVTSTT